MNNDDDLTFNDTGSDYNDDLQDDYLVERPDLPATIALLKAGYQSSVSAALCYGLSGLTRDDIAVIEPIWSELDVEFRRTLTQHLADLSETNFDLDYSQIGLLSLQDDEAEVRENAINLLWDNETPELMAHLIEMAQWDEATAVRAAAVGALGSFILAGELGNLTPADMYVVETNRTQRVKK
ncbi:MAG: HEAT repeat domain-containing protein [Aggregatilineales bacterium]